LGSIRNFESALRDNLKEIDLEKFIGYTRRFPVVSVRKRVGFLLEELGCANKLLNPLRESIGEKRVLVLLNPYRESRQGRINKDWKIIVNR
jgi:predicted transcriptional regulator of viral defense system